MNAQHRSPNCDGEPSVQALEVWRLNQRFGPNWEAQRAILGAPVPADVWGPLMAAYTHLAAESIDRESAPDGSMYLSQPKGREFESRLPLLGKPCERGAFPVSRRGLEVQRQQPAVPNVPGSAANRSSAQLDGDPLSTPVPFGGSGGRGRPCPY
jgi:hypothetical protein